MKGRWREGISVFFPFVSVLAADICVKQYVLRHVYLFYPNGMKLLHTPLGIDLYCQYVENRGGAWGVLSDYYMYLVGVRVLLIVLLIAYVIVKKLSLSQRVCFALVVAGAIGNVVDCLLYGCVIDMIHFVFWQRSYGIFNLADTAIFLGAVGLFFTKQKNKQIYSRNDQGEPVG